MVIPDIAFGLMRSVSILELCLLAFLCLSMNALNSFRPRHRIRYFSGIRRDVHRRFCGWIVVIAQYLAEFAVADSSAKSLVLVTLGLWVAYCVLPEPARKPLVMAANSTIYRWNEIAAALGHGTKVAVQQPANSFFLTRCGEGGGEGADSDNLQSGESKL